MEPTATDDMDRIYNEFYEDRLGDAPKPLRQWIQQYPSLESAFVSWVADIPVLASADRATGSPANEARTIEIGMTVLRKLGFQIEEQVEPEPIRSLYELAGRHGMKAKQLAKQLGMSVTLAAKLERRLIQAATIPEACVAKIAALLAVSSDQIRAYLMLPPTLAAGAAYKSEQAPAAGVQESFSEAVLNCSDMDAAQKDELLN